MKRLIYILLLLGCTCVSCSKQNIPGDVCGGCSGDLVCNTETQLCECPEGSYLIGRSCRTIPKGDYLGKASDCVCLEQLSMSISGLGEPIMDVALGLTSQSNPVTTTINLSGNATHSDTFAIYNLVGFTCEDVEGQITPEPGRYLRCIVETDEQINCVLLAEHYSPVPADLSGHCKIRFEKVR